MKLSSLFYELLDEIAGHSEFASIAILMKAAPHLDITEFHLLLGGAIRQPELLAPRLEAALEENPRAPSRRHGL